MLTRLAASLRDCFNTHSDVYLPAPAALLVIDAQREFCSPLWGRGNAQTRATARRIATLAPEFRAAGVPVYGVYLADVPDRLLADFAQSAPRGFDHYKFRPVRGDGIIIKNWDSALHHPDVAQRLRAAGHTDLLLCGFNLNACVRATALDAAAAGFNVHVLSDLTANNNDNPDVLAPVFLHKMRQHGVNMTTAADQLARLRGPSLK